MMRTGSGIGIGEGIAIGTIRVVRRSTLPTERRNVTDTQGELARFAKAQETAIAQLALLSEKAMQEGSEENAAILEIHGMMLADEDYCDAITASITGEQVNAEYAVAVTGEAFAQRFAAMDDAYMQARAADIRDISDRLIACLSPEQAEQPQWDAPAILCADTLSPSETAALDSKHVLALVTAHGSAGSHTAILARNRGIPAILGVGEAFFSVMEDGQPAIVNAQTGECILHPDAQTLARTEQEREAQREKSARLDKLRGMENITKDGRKIDNFANIGSAGSIGEVLRHDAGGIGLFRSEFLYLEHSDYPSEETQFQVYKQVLERMNGRKVIIRTLDLGADKQCAYCNLPKEENPALGIRGIRLCLHRPALFRTQLRALYRASVHGRLGIMFPMIANVWELEEILAICAEVRAALKGEGISICESTELGIMIETPAAALISGTLAPMVDFFSVGTNDLSQYTLACDRQNPEIARFFDEHHEAVLQLIAMAAQQAHRHGKWIGICGELAADVSLTETFLRMGIDELSVAPSAVLHLRETVRSLDLSQARA